MDTTTPRPRRRSRTGRRLIVTALASVMALATLAPGAPAGALTPLAPDLKGLQGFDQAGPNGYHRLVWGVPAGSSPAIDSWQVQRWDSTQVSLLATYNVAVGQGPDLTVTGMPDEVVFKYRVRAHNSDGYSGWSGFEAIRVHTGLNHWEPFPSEAELIKAHYQDFLGRNPSIGESSTAAANMTNAQGVVSFLTSLATKADRIEHRYPVIRLYLAYFDRAPDHGGLAYWVGRLEAGTATLNTVSGFFSKSNEFKTTYGNLSNAQFVTLVYENVLDRSPDANGLAYWKAKLDQKQMSRAQVMTHFSVSAEGKALRHGDVVVADVYNAMVKNQPPPSAALMLTYGDLVRAGGTAGDLALFVQYLNYYQP